MKYKVLALIALFTFLSVGLSTVSVSAAPAPDPKSPPAPTQICSNKTTFFGIPTWYEYLTVAPDANGNCVVDTSSENGGIAVKVILAIIDILTRVAAMAAVGFVVYGGFLFVSSQGEPAKIVSARKTIMNAVIGLVIALLASQIVKFIAKLLS